MERRLVDDGDSLSQLENSARPFRITGLESGGMILSLHFLAQLDEALQERRIGDGIRLLEHAGAGWTNPDIERGGAAIALRAAQWVDVGHRDRKSVEALLARFSPNMRARMPLRDYLELRLAEAFWALMVEDADAAIELLEFVLKAERELSEESLIILAHFWKGRAHRKKGEYGKAFEHVVEARSRAETMRAEKLAAVIEVQEAWLIFQKGEAKKALALLSHAEQALKDTDDAISLGNIESARGRIVRRTGEYSVALEHYERAITIYARRDINHRNLARTLVNAAYVKRLLALHLRKRIESRANGANPRVPVREAERPNYQARYAAICRDALAQLDRAGEIYRLHEHHGGTGSVLVNAGQLHLDMGEIDRALAEALKAYTLGREKHDQILMARSRILEAFAENARVEEQLGEDGDTAVYANAAQRYAEEAVALAKHTQNRRLLAGAYIVRGMTAANDFFQEWDEAKQCASRAAALLRSDDRDHLWEELITLKSHILRASGINETLRAWSEGMIGDKSFQQVAEEFAEIVIPKVWAREGKKVSRVADRLSISPKKVRRILRSAGLIEQGE
jgi:tetratricopeptide (TPR) repeat protein